MKMHLKGVMLVIVCISPGAAVPGCGSSDEDKIRDAVKNYFSAVAEGGGEEACDQLSGNGQRELVDLVSQQVPEINSIACADVVTELSAVLGPDETAVLEDAEVSAVQIDGNTATATVESAEVDPELVKADDRWLIDGGFAP